MTQPLKAEISRRIEVLREALGSRTKLRLRTKFLLSLVVITSVLTCATLLVMRHSAQEQMQREIEQAARNAILTFQVVQQQHQIALSQKADLLGTLASMRNGDASTIREASEDPWGSSDADLFVIANARGKITALHARISDFRVPTAEALLRGALAKANTTGWWFSGSNLYQVEVQRFYEDFSSKNKLLGAVVVGRALDAKRASDLAQISSSHLVFRYGGRVVLSTLSAFTEPELAGQIRAGNSPQLVQVDGEEYFASSADLTPGMSPGVTLTVLKSNREARGFLRRLKRVVVGMGLFGGVAGGAVGVMIFGTVTR